MIYGMNIIKNMSDKLATQMGTKGETAPITIVVDDNNEDLIEYFLRAARLAKVMVNIQRLTCEPSNSNDVRF